MFTAWGNVRTLTLEVVKSGTTASEFMLLAEVETLKRRGCILLPCIPAPWRCPEWSVTLELLMEGSCCPCNTLVWCIPSLETAMVTAS